MAPVATVIAPPPASDAQKAEKKEDEVEECRSHHEDSEVCGIITIIEKWRNSRC